MATRSLPDFSPLPHAPAGFFFCRNDERTSSTMYLVKNEKKILLIDSGDGKDLLDFGPDVGFLTHGHYDHTRGVQPDWKEVFIHPAENFSLPFMHKPPNASVLPSHEFEFGPFTFEIIHTPGHTPGSICLFEPKYSILFSGDTQFAGNGQGRVDLGGSQKEIYESLGVLAALDWKLLCPGHGDLEAADGKTF